MKSDSPAVHSPASAPEPPLGAYTPAHDPFRAIMQDIFNERCRQNDLIATGRLRFNCASVAVNDDRKLRVLVEEIGEVAEAIDALERTTRPARVFAREALEEELVQVAAVTVAWLEALRKIEENES